MVREVVVVAGGSVGGCGDRGFELGGGNLLHGLVGRGHGLVWMRWRRWRKLRCGKLWGGIVVGRVVLVWRIDGRVVGDGFVAGQVWGG